MAKPPQPVNSSTLRMAAPPLAEVEREQGAAVGLFNESFGTAADEPSDLDAVLLGQALQLGMLLAGERGRHAHRVAAILSHRQFLAAIRGDPRLFTFCPGNPFEAMKLGSIYESDFCGRQT
jgi:hypothetical protein